MKLDIENIIQNLKNASTDLNQGDPYAVIILSMFTEEHMYRNFLKNASFVAVVDGAANYVDVEHLDPNKTILIGDCDSIKSELK